MSDMGPRMLIRPLIRSPRLSSLRKSGFILPLILAMAACGPVHPRWHNASEDDIEISYFHQADVFKKTLRHGAKGMPADFADFQKVERIGITDSGKTYFLNSQQINVLHDKCGHGYKCQISYLEPGHITVTGS